MQTSLIWAVLGRGNKFMPPKPTWWAERFWAKVDKRRQPKCWLWKGATTRKGYGVITTRLKQEYVHRLSYRLHNGPIPEGRQIDHLCRVRNCVNPRHLEAVTSKTNVLRGNAPSAINARKRTCIRGHSLSGPDSRVELDGSRRCLICARRHNRRWILAKKRSSTMGKKACI